MKPKELYDKVVEVATNKTQNRMVFAVLQLNYLVETALAEGMSANVINEVLRDALEEDYIGNFQGLATGEIRWG